MERERHLECESGDEQAIHGDCNIRFTFSSRVSLAVGFPPHFLFCAPPKMPVAHHLPPPPPTAITGKRQNRTSGDVAISRWYKRKSLLDCLVVSAGAAVIFFFSTFETDNFGGKKKMKN